MGAPLTKASVLKKLETVYWLALKSGDWDAALRAAELQGKAVGLFERQRLPEVKRIADMTEEQLIDFISRLEDRDPTLKDNRPPEAEKPVADRTEWTGFRGCLEEPDAPGKDQEPYPASLPPDEDKPFMDRTPFRGCLEERNPPAGDRPPFGWERPPPD